MGFGLQFGEKRLIMKKSDITYQEKINELRLDILHPNSKKTNFVLLEGDTDVRLFRKIFDLNICKVEWIPGGNIKLEECIDTLIKSHPLILGIRDSDFIKIHNKDYQKINIFLTDLHDMEMTMLNFDLVFNTIMCEYSKISDYEYTEIKNALINIISPIGFFKLLNHVEQLELSFKVGFHDLIDFNNQKFDIEKYIDRVFIKSSVMS